MAGPGDHCACPRLDAHDCAEYRTNPIRGRPPDPDDIEPCECPCHDDGDDEDDEFPEED